MRQPLLLLLSFLAFNLAAQAQSFNPDKKYHPDSLRRWTVDVLTEISKKHPGFYRYTPKQKFDKLIDSTVQRMTDSLTALQYYRKLKPLFAQIGCLHTGISLSKEYEDYLGKTSTLLPFEIFIDSENRVWITKSFDASQNNDVGKEIISINGRSISDVVAILLKAIPSDGFNQTEKLFILNHRFSFWYQTVIEVTERFVVELKSDSTIDRYTFHGVSKQVFPSRESIEHNYKKPLEFEKLGNTGILKVHSFAHSTLKLHHQRFRKFIRHTFNDIRNSGVQHLIIDLRYNTGGTDGNPVYLASYFFDKPFRYWDNITVTEGIAKEISGWKRLFYKKPLKQNDGTFQWRKTWVTNEFDYYETQKPQRHPFHGNVYLLTNGLCLSSCADFVAILSYNHKAIVVGQETGGGYQGNTSGMIPKATLPTGLRISVPLQKYTNAVDPTKNVGRGTIPDFEIEPTLDDWINKRDVAMEFVKSQIKETSR